jgi:hypothetical protein
MASSWFHHCHVPLTQQILQVLLRDLRRRPTEPYHSAMRKEKLLPLSLSRSISLFSLSLFSRRKGGGGIEGYHVIGCKLHRSYQVSFIAPQCNSRGGKAVGFY